MSAKLPSPRSEDAGKPARAKAPNRASACPICGTPAAAGYSPFCSSRCADIDLGHWLGGRYAVPGEPLSREPEEED